MALVSGKMTEAWLCQSNPSCTSWWQASTTKTKKNIRDLKTLTAKQPWARYFGTKYSTWKILNLDFVRASRSWLDLICCRQEMSGGFLCQSYPFVIFKLFIFESKFYHRHSWHLDWQLSRVRERFFYSSWTCGSCTCDQKTNRVRDLAKLKNVKLYGTIKQNLPQLFLKVLFSLSGRSGDPRGQHPLVGELRHNIGSG